MFFFCRARQARLDQVQQPRWRWPYAVGHAQDYNKDAYAVQMPDGSQAVLLRSALLTMHEAAFPQKQKETIPRGTRSEPGRPSTHLDTPPKRSP